MGEFLEQKAREIAEHFPDCQILASYVDDNGTTRSKYRGQGNHYARQGMAKEFVDSSVSYELSKDIAYQIKQSKEDDL